MPPPRRESFHRPSLKNTRLRLQHSFSTASNSSLSSLRSSHLSIPESPSPSDSSAKKLNRGQSLKKNINSQQDLTESTADVSIAEAPANIGPSRRQSTAGKLTSRLTRRLSSAQALGRRKSVNNTLFLQSLDQAGTADLSSAPMSRVQRRKSQAMLKLGSSLETPAPNQPATTSQLTEQSIGVSKTLETQQAPSTPTISYTPTKVTSLGPPEPASRPSYKEDTQETHEENKTLGGLGPREFRVGEVIRILHQPAYNEQTFDSKIEQDLGYRVYDAYLREATAELVYSPKSQAQFGFDGSVPGAKTGNGPLVQVVDFYSGRAESLGYDEDDVGSVASNKSLGMPKNNSQLDLLMAKAGMSYGDLSEATSSHRALTTPQA